MISRHAVVETDQIGSGTVIHPFAVVRPGVSLGARVVVHPNVVIESGVVIEDDVEVFPGTYLGKEPKGAGATAREPVFKKEIYIGRGCAIGPNAVIYYDVSVGNNTLIGDGASIREGTQIGSYCIISRYVTINYDTSIGSRTKIMDQTHITGKSKIGDNVFIGMLVSTANDRSMGKQGYVESAIQGPIISDGVCIGSCANILPGVQIGQNAIVGGSSVVTKDVPPSKKVLGVPAKVVGDV